MADQSAIWMTNPDNSWRLYSNTDYVTPQPQQSASKDSKEKQHQQQQSPTQPKSQTPSPFSFTKLKPVTKGSVTCTSKGYGVIQAFHEDKNTVSVKIEGQVCELPQNEVLSDIPLSIGFFNKSVKREEVIYLPISSTMNEVIERAEASLTEDDKLASIRLYLSGKEVNGTTDTLEKLKILPWTKLLAIPKQKKAMRVSRYASVLPGWSFGSGSVASICFTPNKSIRVTGFGMYKPMNGSLTATVKLIKGSRSSIEPMYSGGMSIGADAKDIAEVQFDKAYTINAGEPASLVVKGTDASFCTTSYGNGGKESCEGEGGVVFTFKACDDLIFNGNYDSGLLPEIYYYA